jgi:hypothetical protein
MGRLLRSDLGTYLIAPNDCITSTQRKNKYELRSPPVHSFCPTRSAGTSYVDEWERNLRGNKTGWPAKSQGWQCKSLCQGASRLAAKLSTANLTVQERTRCHLQALLTTSPYPLSRRPLRNIPIAISPSQAIREYSTGDTRSITVRYLLIPTGTTHEALLLAFT